MLRNKLYYRVKPFIPQFVRTAIRRQLASVLRARVANTWPIMPGSGRPPEGWPGWPQGKKFALVLTHDVETLNGLQKCRQLMELEQELGFRSSFNFVPEGEYEVPPALREELVRNGFEVGIHDLRHDGRLYESRREFRKSAARINNYLSEWQVEGFRSAFMLNELDWLLDLNVKYDASTFDTDPFEPQPQGRQTIFPFWVSPRISDRTPESRSGYVELPYTLPQDSTLFLLLREETPKTWFRKLDWLAEHRGMALVITHPDYISFNGSTQTSSEYPAELYRQFLQYVEERYSGEYWPALPKEVAAYTYQNMVRSDASQRAGNEQVPALDLSYTVRPYVDNRWRLRGKRAAVLLFSYYPSDPRPRRAAEALAAENVKVDVVCLQRDRTEPRREVINGVSVFRVPLKRRRAGKIRYISQYAIFILRSFLYLARHGLFRRYHFVHVHNMPDVLVFSALIPKLLGAKIILDLHDPVPELMQTIFNAPEKSFSVRLLKQLEKWSIRFADSVVTVNLACQRIYAHRSCSASKIGVVLNSPEDDIFHFQAGSQHSNGESGKPFVVLYHGSLVRRNGFDLAVDAIELAKKLIPGIRLAVCGESTPFFEQVMESARNRGLEKNVDYLGVKDRYEIVEAINRCSLGVIPNHRNIFTEINTPTRIFEYLALGKPVIAPGTRGIRDYFDVADLIYFEVGNAADLARQIEFAYFHPEEVKKIVFRGQQVYLTHRWSRQKSNLLNLVGDLV